MASTSDEMLRFVLNTGTHNLSGPRVGQLVVRGRAPVSTPHFVVPTSRGVIPHVSPDILEKRTAISAIYLGLEDCMSHALPSNYC
jgi:queuine tRNA-ribosyltransferase accessory subunit